MHLVSFFFPFLCLLSSSLLSSHELSQNAYCNGSCVFAKMKDQIKRHLFFIEVFRKKYLCVFSTEKEQLDLCKNFFKTSFFASFFCDFLCGEKQNCGDTYLLVEQASSLDILFDAALAICVFYKLMTVNCKEKRGFSLKEIKEFLVLFSNLPLDKLFQAIEDCHYEFHILLEQYLSSQNTEQLYEKEAPAFLQTLSLFMQVVSQETWVLSVTIFGLYCAWKKWNNAKGFLTFNQ